MSRLLITFLIIVTTACSRTSNSTEANPDKADSLRLADNVTADTLMIYKIKFDTSYNYIFPKTFRATDLSQEEIDLCETLLRQYISAYNKEAKLRFEEISKKYPTQKFNLLDFTIELREYGRQYMAAISDKGQKFVYVNCLCDPTQFDTLENDLIEVDDGGNCYFNFKVDLTTKRLFDFMENGVA